MGSDRNQSSRSPLSPEGAWEELLAAVEAATGASRRVAWRDPMSPAPIREALDMVLLADRPDRGLDVLSRSGVLGSLLPEVQAMVGFGEGIRHKDVWVHTRQVVRQAPPRLVTRWAALLHDIGKVTTRRFEPDGQVTFIGHPEAGARMFLKICRRIPFDADLAERLRFIIAGHLRPAAYEEGWTDSAIRRFARDAGDNLEDLLDLARADITSKYQEKVRRGLRQIDRLAARIEAVKAADARPALLPSGLGDALMTRLGIVPGPGLGRLMQRLREAVEAGRLEALQEHEHYVAFVTANPDLARDL